MHVRTELRQPAAIHTADTLLRELSVLQPSNRTGPAAPALLLQLLQKVQLKQGKLLQRQGTLVLFVYHALLRLCSSKWRCWGPL